MSLIRVIEKEDATGQVAAIYENMVNAIGFVPNAFKIYSTSDHLLETQVGNLGYFMRHKTLGGKLLALVRLLVSVQEHCTYCVGVNTGILMQYGILPEMAEAIKADPSKAPLDEKEMAMLLFVLKVVKDSNAVDQADVDRLKALGWSDSDILEGAWHGASQVAADKIFNAFKIESDM